MADSPRTPSPKKKHPEITSPVAPNDPSISDEEVLAHLMGDSGDPPEGTAVTASESAVNLGESGGPPASSQTPAGDSFEWASLADRPALSSGGGEPARFDSPSDADVLRKSVPPPEEEEESVFGTLPLIDVESSRVDLSEMPPSEDPLASRGQEMTRTPAHHGEPLSYHPAETYVPPRHPEPPPPSEEHRLETTAHHGEPPDRLKDTVSRPQGRPITELGGTVHAHSGPPPIELPEEGNLTSKEWPPSDSAVDFGSGIEIIDDSASGASSIVVRGPVVVAPSDSALNLGGDSAPVVVDSRTGLHSGIEILPQESSASDVVVGADSGASGIGSGVSKSGVDIGMLAGADSSPSSAPPRGADESGIDLGPAGVAAFEERPAGESGIDLTAITATDHAESSSGLDLEEVSATADEAAFGTEPVEEGGSAVDLGAIFEEGSHRDLIAEAVESGVDLTKSVHDKPDTGSYAEVVIGDQPAAADGASSAVDLGAAVEIVDEPSPAPFGQPGTITWDSGMEMPGLPEPHAGIADTAAADSGKVHLEDGPPSGVSDSIEGTLDDHSAAPAADEVFDDMGGGAAVAEEEPMAAAEEEPVAAAEEEPVAEPEEEEEETLRVTQPVRPKYGRRWAGGILVGSLLGAAAVVGVLRLDVVPKDLRAQVLGEEEKKSDGDEKKQKPVVATNRALLDSADWSKTATPPAEGDKEDLVNHGRFVFLKYLNQTPQLKADAPEVQQALQSFKAAGTAEGMYWQGYVYERLGNAAEARKLYDAALKGPGAQQPAKEMFESAIHRLELQSPAAAPPVPPTGRLSTPSNALLLFTLLQPPPMGGEQPPPPPDAPKLPQEAGFSYWSAVRLAQQQKYTDALKAIAEARKRHTERRMSQLMKAQNPISDPTEDIFLRACDELKAYFELQEKLAKGKYLEIAANKTDPSKAIDALLKDATDAKAALAALQTKYDDLETEKKKADAKVTTLTTDLAKSKDETKAALEMVTERDTKLKKAGDDLKAEMDRVTALNKKADGLETDRKDMEEAVRTVGKALDLENLDPKTGKPMLFKKLMDVMVIYKERDPAGLMMRLTNENRQLTGTLAERWTPAAMLGYWQPLLQDRAQTALAASAVKDVERVKADAKATAESRALAAYVDGLAARNQGDTAKARDRFAESLKDANAGKDTWRKTAELSLAELTDPNAYYIPRAEALRGQRKYAECLAALDEAMKVFGDKNGKLLAFRSHVRLDQALEQTGGKVKLDTPGMAEASRDAADASSAGAKAEGAFAMGRLYEAVGQPKEASEQYRDAIKAAPAESIEAVRYRLALARVLLQIADAKPTARLPIEPRDLLVLSLVGLQGPPPEQAAQDEAVREAEAILKRPDIDQHPLLKAEALTVLGLQTEALNTYVSGLKSHLNREQYSALKSIIDNHPMQRQPDRMRVPHPFQAQRFYTAGLSQFYANDFAGAEASFTRAVEHFDQDARYHYFLGLARLKQNKPGGPEAFFQAAMLEYDNRPSRDAVDASLERIQGPTRRMIDAARNKVR